MTKAYTIQSGDTLSAIAQKQGTTVSALMSANPQIKNKNLIYAGANLTIPTPQTGTYIKGSAQAPVATPVKKTTTSVTQKQASGMTTKQLSIALAKQNQTQTQSRTPVGSQNQATDFINAKQDEDILSAKTSDEPPVRGALDLVEAFKTATGKSGLIPDYTLPELPSFEENFATLRGQFNVADLETTINDLDAQEQDLQAQLRVNIKAEEGKPVAMNVIAGRVGEQERNMMERIDFIQRQKSRAVAQLQTANDAIENIMNFRKMDYELAKDQYDTEFSQNIQLFNVIKGAATFESSEEDKEQDNARANLQIIYNSMKDGNIDMEVITESQKTKIHKLELQAGLPQGFYESVQAEKPKAKVLSTTTRVTGNVKFADIIYQNEDGSLTTESVRIGASGKATTGDGTKPEVSWEDYIGAAQEELKMSLVPDTDLYKQLEAQYKKDYPEDLVGFSDTEIKKLEQAGLLGASRSEQLDFLYGEDEEDDNPFK